MFEMNYEGPTESNTGNGTNIAFPTGPLFTSIPEKLYAVTSTLVGVECTMALFVNIIVIRTILIKQELWKSTHIIMCSIAIANCLLSVMDVIVTVISNASKYYTLGKTMCAVEGVFTGFINTATLTLTVFMYVFRELDILGIFPEEKISKLVTIIGLISGWIWSIAWHVPLLIWDGFYVEGIGTNCGVHWRNSGIRSFLLAHILFCFYIPVFAVIMGCTVVRIKQRRLDNNQRNETASMIPSLFMTLLVFWTPKTLLSTYLIFDEKTMVNPYLATACILLAKMVTTSCPIIYWSFDPEFSKCVEETFVSDAISRKHRMHKESDEVDYTYEVLLRAAMMRQRIKMKNKKNKFAPCSLD